MNRQCNDPETGALLHAWEIGALSEEDVERFETHLVGCHECFEEVQAFAPKAALLRQDKSVHDEVNRAAAQVAASPGTDHQQLRGLRNFLYQIYAGLSLRSLAYVLVVLLAYPAYRGILTEFDPTPLIGPVQSIQLAPTRATRSAAFSKQKSATGVISFPFPDAVAGEDYVVVIKDEEGNEIHGYSKTCTNTGMEIVQLSLALTNLRTGTYQLIISIPFDKTAKPIGYYFKVKD